MAWLMKLSQRWSKTINPAIYNLMFAFSNGIGHAIC
jgi:hypothetical protein